MGFFVGFILGIVVYPLIKIAGLLVSLAFKISVHGRSVHSLVKIDKVTVKIGAVHTGKLCLAAHGEAAAAAHARAVNHNRVHGHDGLDVLGLGQVTKTRTKISIPK